MNQSILEKLCCPSCKGQLELKTKASIKESIIEGSMLCNGCNKEYIIIDGILRMYIPDGEIISRSDKSKFSQFIITSEHLDKWIQNSKSENDSSFYNKIPSPLLVGLGWILLLFCISILFITYLNYDVMVSLTDSIDSTVSKLPLLAISVILLIISTTLFYIDYKKVRLRKTMKGLDDLCKLKELADTKELSEYDIRSSTEDRESDFKAQFERQKDFVGYKGEIIEAILEKYNFNVKSSLNVGCGGELHEAVSKPYFKRDYGMLGVDINEEYLIQFRKIFHTDVVEANSMALPFGDNTFDLVNFTDIVEHLHHPFLGLSEVLRVLRTDGVLILTTNNRSSYKLPLNPLFFWIRFNPLVFFERVISLYYDRVLPPRNMLGSWMDFNFYHTEFSKNEITSLIESAGFIILHCETNFPRKQLEKVNKIYRRIPGLRFFGEEFLIIGRKPKSSSI